MKTYRVFLGLGSNLGHRYQALTNAVSELKKIRDTKVVWPSSVYETDPYGKTDQAKFLNAVVEIQTALGPAELFAEMKTIEVRLGRSSTEHWGPREIDIDILMYDGVVFDDENVRVPHPDLEQRKFALVPLAEIAPGLIHPVNGMTVEELVASCTDSGRVVRTSHHLLV